MKIFIEPIASTTDEAKRMLVERAFGPGRALAHHPDGAPYIVGSELHISISHTRRECVLAVCDKPVGIDIETARDQLVRVAGKFLAPGEHPEMTPQGLLPYWTAKEAVYKCARTPGLGLTEIEVNGDTATARGSRYRLVRPRIGMTAAVEIE